MYCVNCGAQIPDNSQFCFNCGNKSVNTSSVGSSYNASPVSISQIKEYLFNAKKLEINYLTLTKIRDKLQSKINSLGHYSYIEYPSAEIFDEFSIWFKISFPVILLIGFVIAALISGNFWANLLSLVTVVLIFFNTDLLIGFATALGVAIVGALIIGILAAISESIRYRKALNLYNQKINDDQTRVAREQQQIMFLKREQDAVESKMCEVENTLNRLYSLNVVYPKYRSLVPIVTLYEYFDSGRHTNLADAYNKYEDELLHKNIIEKLDIVISKLEQIKQNQYALYEAIQESNYLSEQIYRKSESILASNQAIEQYSAVAAYNSKVAADNSAISAFINMSRL